MINENNKIYKNFSQDDINLEFVNACKLGNINLVNFLLTSEDLLFNADVSTDRNQGLINACLYNNLEVMKFILNSPLLKTHADIHVSNEIIFKTACLYEREEQISFLINEMKLQQNAEIIDYLKNYPNVYAEKLFLQRDLFEELPESNNQKKSIKI
jgi:hypothetical protein